MKSIDRKLIYRQIVMLQSFASVWLRYQHVKDHTNIYEVIRLAKNKAGLIQKYTTFMLSDDRLPVIDILAPAFVSTDIKLLDSSDVNRYIHLCNEYGIPLLSDETK